MLKNSKLILLVFLNNLIMKNKLMLNMGFFIDKGKNNENKYL